MRIGPAFLSLFASILVRAPAPLVAQRIEVPGRKCEPMRESQVPALARVLDSAATMTNLAAAVPDTVWGQAMISIVWSETGEAGRARVLMTDLPESRAAPLLRAVAGNILDMSPNSFQGTRVLVSWGGTEPSLRIEPAMWCPPVLDETSPTGPVGKISVGRSDQPSAMNQRIQSPQFRFLVTDDGRVSTIEMQKSSGEPQLDQALSNMIQRRIYKPALVDGVPIAHWLREQ